MKKITRSLFMLLILATLVFSSGCNSNSDENVDTMSSDENKANTNNPYVCTEISICQSAQDDDSYTYIIMEYDQDGKITDLYLSASYGDNTEQEHTVASDLAWDENGNVKQAIIDDGIDKYLLSFLYNNQNQLKIISVSLVEDDDLFMNIYVERDTNGTIEKIKISMSDYSFEIIETLEFLLDHDENGNPTNGKASTVIDDAEIEVLLNFDYMPLNEYLQSN